MFYNNNNLLVGKIASKDESRPILNGVKFEPEATIATDGFKMLIVETPKDVEADDMGDLPSVNQSNYNVVIDKDTVENVRRSLPKKPILPWLKNAYFTDSSDDVAQMITTDGLSSQKHSAHVVEGDYPAYAAVIPSGSPLANTHVNVKFLKQLVDTLNQMDIEENTIQINVYADDMPVTITAKTEQDQNVQAVIMPVKVK